MINIVMTISEIAHSGRYEAHAECRYLCTSAQPFHDGAYILAEQGYDHGKGKRLA